MPDSPNQLKKPLKIALSAVFAALVLAVTYSFAIINAATSGYFNLGETIIYIAALVFGPFVGAVSGGIGSAISDVLLAPQYAPGTLVIKGLEGLIVGFLNIKLKKYIESFTIRASISVAIGGLEMVTGYFLYELLILGYPLAIVLGEIPLNFLQMIIGLIVAIPIVYAVFQAFPQFKSVNK